MRNEKIGDKERITSIWEIFKKKKVFSGQDFDTVDFFFFTVKRDIFLSISAIPVIFCTSTIPFLS